MAFKENLLLLTQNCISKTMQTFENWNVGQNELTINNNVIYVYFLVNPVVKI